MTTEAEQRILDGSAWREFCRALERAGEAVLRPETPMGAFDRAEGFRYLTRLLRAGLESQVEFADPRFPGFFQLANETIKIGNDNPDNIYRNANVSGRYRYRIWGTRGGAPLLSLGTKGGGYESDGTMVPTGQIDSDAIDVGPDGRFEIFVSAEPEKGNWLPMKPNTTQLVVRETFTDRATQEPARYAIERLGPPEDDTLDPTALEARLLRAVAFVSGTANLFVDWMTRYAAHPNALPSDDQELCQRAGGDANIHYCQSRWLVGPDEALVIEAPRIPKRGSWNFQLSNYWMESLDYRHHRIHLNPHSAVLERDGSLRIVVAHRNPGARYPNWLETAGHTQGGMLFRWIGTDDHPPLAARLVKLAELSRVIHEVSVSGGSRLERASRAPCEPLRRHVHSLVGFDDQSPGPRSRREFPEPWVVVIIDFGRTLRVTLAGDERTAIPHPGGFAAGLGDRFAITQHDGRQRGVQVDLSPTGARRLFGLPMSEVAGRIVSLRDLLPREHEMLIERLAASADWGSRLDLVEELLARRILGGNVDTTRVDWAVAQIESSGGMLDVGRLARELGYSHKHLIALFHDQVGVPPKLLARLVRFERVMREARSGVPIRWADLALAHGYFDQSHLARDVRRFTGLAPTEAAAGPR